MRVPCTMQVPAVMLYTNNSDEAGREYEVRSREAA